MRIGDKVRLLRGTEEGRIVNIKNNKIVEIEIEDGFTIPALINEVVVISSMEAEVFKPEEPESNEALVNKRNQDFISEGIYLGFKEAEDQKFEAFIINQTTNTILFSVSQYDKKMISGKAFGICEQYDAKEIGSFTSSIFNESKRILVQVIIHEDESRLKRPPQTFEEHISKDQLEELTYLSSLSSEVALIKLGERLSIKIDPRELQNKMMDNNPIISKPKDKGPKYSDQTIDLHVDSFSTNLKPNEILEFQLNEFEKAYDNALVMNLEKLKIVHGVGAGILRNEIHKRLSKKSDVKYFEDADKERFGFGSTIIYF